MRPGGLICWALMKVIDGRSQQRCVGKSSHRAEQEVRERLRGLHSTLFKKNNSMMLEKPPFFIAVKLHTRFRISDKGKNHFKKLPSKIGAII